MRDVSLSVAPGEIVLIMGTLGFRARPRSFRCLGHCSSRVKARSHSNGTTISALEENRLPDIRLRQFGFVFQDFNLLSL